mgnify:CR=1 FL=1
MPSPPTQRVLRVQPLALRLIAVALVGIVATAAATMLLAQWLDTWLASLLATLACGTLTALFLWHSIVPLRSLFRALAGTVASYRDGDYNFGITWNHYGELIELVDAHNELGNVLREQRQSLVQRELLLDTVVQNTPVAMVLLDPAQRVVLGNIAARKLLGEGRKLEGQHLDVLLEHAPEPMRDALLRGGDGMFSVGDDDNEDIYHLSRRLFRLNGRHHELILLRQLTAELRRQEVQTWKKVIRVISHELNNSLAPIASLAHSCRELVRRGQLGRLPGALETIEERARHLEGFIRDYARFAKLPAPRLESVDWPAFLEKLRSQVDFVLVLGSQGHGRIDAAQVEQALLNLLKNAHESGSAPEDVRLLIRRTQEAWRIDVMDRGSGMNSAVLSNAVLPFYSTKRNGTGLGLALVREIAEAHGGRVSMINRDGGGLVVSLILPV